MEPQQVYDRRDELQIIDVRDPEEWQSGRIEQARHIPMDELQARLAEIDPGRPVITVCRSGNRSGEAAQQLQQQGYDAQNMAGGLQAWDQTDLPLTTPEGQQGRVA